MMLKAQEFFSPTCKEIDTKELKMFCKAVSVGLQLVPRGSALVPPDVNKPELEYDPAAMKDRKKKSGAGRGGAAAAERMFSANEIDDIKSRFNRLYEETTRDS
ncbi:unnamed protein product [Phaeothamnion confervicola]